MKVFWSQYFFIEKDLAIAWALVFEAVFSPLLITYYLLQYSSNVVFPYLRFAFGVFRNLTVVPLIGFLSKILLVKKPGVFVGHVVTVFFCS